MENTSLALLEQLNTSQALLEQLNTSLDIAKTTADSSINNIATLRIAFDTFENQVLAGDVGSGGTTLSSGYLKITIPANVRTSIGIFNSDDQLVRTLRSGVIYDAGDHVISWDGKQDDYTTVCPDGTYTVKILNSAITYKWEGVVGNSSNTTLVNKLGGYDGIGGLACGDDSLFHSVGYAERGVSHRYVNYDDIGSQYILYPDVLTSIQTQLVTTDGDRVYYAGIDNTWTSDKVSSHLIVGFDIATKGVHMFPYGNSEHIDIGNDYPSVIQSIRQNGADFAGLTVQRNGKLLIASRPGLNRLDFIDKITGQLYKSIDKTTGKILAGQNDELWTLESNPNYDAQTSKYTNSAGNKLTGTVFVSGTRSDTTVDQAGDGNTGTRWISDGNPAIYGIDFGSPKVLYGIDFLPSDQAMFASNITVQGSNTSTTDGFVTIASWGDIGLNRTVTTISDTTPYRYVRLTKSDNLMLIGEIAFIERALVQPICVKKYIINDTITNVSTTNSLANISGTAVISNAYTNAQSANGVLTKTDFSVVCSIMSPAVYTFTPTNNNSFIVTRLDIAPEQGHPQFVQGAWLQGSNNNSDWTDIYQIPNPANLTENQINTLTFTNTIACKYFRLNHSDIINISYLRLYGQEIVVSFTGDVTLTDTGLVIDYLPQPEALAISRDNTVLLIADGTDNQIRAYDPTNLNLRWILGQKGGYVTNGPAVTYDKFMFHEPNSGISSTAMDFEADGSFWACDWGNYRVLHFTSDLLFVEQLSYVPKSRSCNVDINNSNSVFADTLEYYVDYTLPLAGKNGSWRLVNNWSIGVSLDTYARFIQIITLSNGRTYGTSGSRLYELDLKLGAIDKGQFYGVFEADGSITNRHYGDVGNDRARVTKQALLGFDSNNIPQYGPEIFVAQTPRFDNVSPVWYIHNIRGASTNPRKYFFYRPDPFSGMNGRGYALAAVNQGSTADVEGIWNWRAALSTYGGYSGDWPRDGAFDIGNGGHSENCMLYVDGTNLIWNANGEFWGTNKRGGNECNIWQHFHESGLFIGSFGVTGADTYLNNSSAGMAGNAFKGALAKVGGDYYIYHCDESVHAGTHRWKISNLNSVSLQSTTVILSGSVTPIADPTDMMAGLPYRATTFSGDANLGWTVTPAPQDGFGVGTSNASYQPYEIDIAAYVRKDSGEYKIEKALPVTNTNNWKLNLDIYIPSLIYAGTPMHLQILDINGKAILDTTFGAGIYNTGTVITNKVEILTQDNTDLLGRSLAQYEKFSIITVDGTMNVQYAGLPIKFFTKTAELGADGTKPATLSLKIYGAGNGQAAFVSMKNIKFIPQASTSVIVNPIYNLVTNSVYTATNGTNYFDYGSNFGSSVIRGGLYKWHINNNGILKYSNNAFSIGETYRFVLEDIEYINGTGYVTLFGIKTTFIAADVENNKVTVNIQCPSNWNGDPAFYFGSDSNADYYTSGYKIYLIR